jgi:sialate O-acetylesterase
MGTSWLKRLFVLLPLVLCQLPVSAQTKKIKIACIGNSVTYGYTLPDPATQSYPALLQKKLGDHYTVKNFGHSGATLLKKGHNPYYKTKEFAAALHFHADIAIVDLGLNDTDPRDWPNYRDDFMPDYNWLIDTLRASNPAMKVFICTMTPIFTGHPRFMSSTFTWYRQVQKRIADIAKINHTGLIDLYAGFHDRPDLFTDPPTLHPNVQGAAKLCNVIYKNITGNFGGLRLAGIFTDHMVLQRDRPIPVWGMANAGTAVEVTFDHQTRTVRTAPDGKWKVFFPKMQASDGTYSLKIQNGGKEITCGDILIGDVWLCSGQSNMYFSLAEAKGGKATAQKANEKAPLRLFKYVPYAETNAAPWDSTVLAKADNLDFFHGAWKLNNEKAADEFSAVGYYFGKKIRQEQQVPVGLIELAVGGSPQISWLDRLTIEAHPLFEPALHDWRHSDYIMEWCRQRAAVNLKNAESPYQRHPYDPCFNFEAGVARITQFPIKGVIWYQGASDAENAELYGKLFPVFVKDWRDAWGYDFPFYYVQLSSIDRPSWNYFRDTQRKLLKIVPHTGMVVTSDLGDPTNVHYTDKKPVGLRLARLALHDSYGKKDVVPGGPLVTAAIRKGGRIEITFSENKGLTTADGKPLQGFKIINGSGYLVPVTAKIRENNVFINIPGKQPIKKIVYGWKPFTRANLVNGARLPASTFMISVK